MPQDDQQTPAPFCLRLTQGERAQLKDKAGAMAFGAYIRAQIFDSPTRRARRVRHVTPNTALLTQILDACRAILHMRALPDFDERYRTALTTCPFRAFDEFLDLESGMVPPAGVEPAHPHGYLILSQARLPVPPRRHVPKIIFGRLTWAPIILITFKVSTRFTQKESPPRGKSSPAPLSPRRFAP